MGNLSTLQLKTVVKKTLLVCKLIKKYVHISRKKYSILSNKMLEQSLSGG
jgi:hypothetical protein